jgi:hypothetical protein
LAKVINGTVDFNSAALDGLTVGEVREQFGDILQVPDGARSTIDGRQVSNDTVVNVGDTLVFDMPTGSKGR